MTVNDRILGIEHNRQTTTVYGFFNRSELQKYLEEHQIPCNGLTPVTMTFEDAFIGLTGKY